MAQVYTDGKWKEDGWRFRKPAGMPRTRWKNLKEKTKKEDFWKTFRESLVKKNE